MIRFVPIELLRLALRFFGAHKVLQRGFQIRDFAFRAGDLFFQFLDAILHLFALERVPELPLFPFVDSETATGATIAFELSDFLAGTSGTSSSVGVSCWPPCLRHK